MVPVLEKYLGLYSCATLGWGPWAAGALGWGGKDWGAVMGWDGLG